MIRRPLRAATAVNPEPAQPDGALVAAALEGEEAAFGEIVARYEGPLLRVAMSRLARRELAEEVVQETFLCAHRWLESYDSRFSFRTWLWAILLNQCARQGKREARQPAATESSEERVTLVSRGHSASPLEQLLARESAAQVHALLRQLPGTQADALRLRFFAGLTFPEIAAAMDISEPGAKNRVKTGLMKLATLLRPGQIEDRERSKVTLVAAARNEAAPGEIVPGEIMK